jgi:hypothetical protein
MPIARWYILERLLNEHETGATRYRLKCHADNSKRSSGELGITRSSASRVSSVAVPGVLRVMIFAAWES